MSCHTEQCSIFPEKELCHRGNINNHKTQMCMFFPNMLNQKIKCQQLESSSHVHVKVNSECLKFRCPQNGCFVFKKIMNIYEYKEMIHSYCIV